MKTLFSLFLVPMFLFSTGPDKKKASAVPSSKVAGCPSNQAIVINYSSKVVSFTITTTDGFNQSYTLNPSASITTPSFSLSTSSSTVCFYQSSTPAGPIHDKLTYPNGVTYGCRFAGNGERTGLCNLPQEGCGLYKYELFNPADCPE